MKTMICLSLALVFAAAHAASAGDVGANGCPVVAPAATPAVAQANSGYRSFSFEPAAAAQVPQGGQAYRSYSYQPAAAPTYRSTYTHGYRSVHPAYMTQKSLR